MSNKRAAPFYTTIINHLEKQAVNIQSKLKNARQIKAPKPKMAQVTLFSFLAQDIIEKLQHLELDKIPAQQAVEILRQLQEEAGNL